MCIGAAVDGKNKDDARKNHGFTGMIPGQFWECWASISPLWISVRQERRYLFWDLVIIYGKVLRKPSIVRDFSGFLQVVLRHRLWESVVR